MPIQEKTREIQDPQICKIFDSGVSVEQWKNLVSDGKFFCKKCGRVATKAENVCEPVPL
jgi:hypothetical protein